MAEHPIVRRRARQFTVSGTPGSHSGGAGMGEAGNQRLPVIEEGGLLRSIPKKGKMGESLGDWAVWSMIERRTSATLCRKGGGDLEQIELLLGHSSIQTTERWLGSEQDLKTAVNDNLGSRCTDGRRA
jgi:hypothetical protein